MDNITVPVFVTIPRKTKSNRRVTLNLNVYRNLHYHVSNQAKKIFKEDIKESISRLPIYKRPLKIHYTIFLHRKGDLMNVASIVDKFFCDALIDLGRIKDDNCDYIQKVSVEYGGIDKNNPRCEVEIGELNG